MRAETYDVVIIGAGQARIPLAWDLAGKSTRVALVERARGRLLHQFRLHADQGSARRGARRASGALRRGIRYQDRRHRGGLPCGLHTGARRRRGVAARALRQVLTGATIPG